ncbi:MAG: hypothetical protein KA764_08830 [Anaerolineales bacterium]|nr:hypothetical protein [Anaerolineales bacterium]
MITKPHFTELVTVPDETRLADPGADLPADVLADPRRAEAAPAPALDAPASAPLTAADRTSEMFLYESPAAGRTTPEMAENTSVGSLAALLDHKVSERLRTRWNEIQGRFVDEPRVAVQQADTLVSEVIGQITQMFAGEHGALEGQWNQGQDVSTEDLRQALQRYRSFFNRLVV